LARTPRKSGLQKARRSCRRRSVPAASSPGQPVSMGLVCAKPGLSAHLVKQINYRPSRFNPSIAHRHYRKSGPIFRFGVPGPSQYQDDWAWSRALQFAAAPRTEPG
jgi:hypothetical protein